MTLSAARVRIKNPRAGHPHPVRSRPVRSAPCRQASRSRFERAKDGASVANLSALSNPPLSSFCRIIPAYGGEVISRTAATIRLGASLFGCLSAAHPGEQRDVFAFVVFQPLSSLQSADETARYFLAAGDSVARQDDGDRVRAHPSP